MSISAAMSDLEAVGGEGSGKGPVPRRWRRSR